jgi:hypothetical protein
MNLVGQQNKQSMCKIGLSQAPILCRCVSVAASDTPLNGNISRMTWQTNAIKWMKDLFE